MERLVILSGPSCVGKGPLCRAMRKFHPDLMDRLARVVLYNSRRPRPDEVDGVDYHFRDRKSIDELRGQENFSVFDVRGDLQALDIGRLREKLTQGDVLFEGNPFISSELLDFVRENDVRSLSIFLSPLSREEILELGALHKGKTAAEVLTDIMRRKLLRRTARYKGILSLPDLENIETRAGSAPGELQQAWRYDWVIPNHDGEDSENWDGFYHPIGDARKTLGAFADLLRGQSTARAEKWERDLTSFVVTP